MRMLLALAAVGLLSLAATPSLAGASAAPRYRVQRVCGKPPAGAAACLSMKLVPADLSSSELQANASRQAAEAGRGARPAVSVKSPIPGYLTPQRLHEAYALPSDSLASSLQTVAVVDAYDDPTAEADLDVYDKQFGLSACTTANGCFRKLNQDGQPGPLPPKEGEWAGEISIDVQMAHAICETCKVLLVEADNESFASLGHAVNAAVNAGATVVSNSYGAPERSPSSAKLASLYFDHPGVVITASSGDCGYLNTACGGLRDAAEFPAGAPGVVAIGGTSLKQVKKAWTSTTWDEGGSGCSLVFSAPAWQSATPNFSATGCAAGRSVADVSAIGDPNTGVDVYDSTPEGNGNPTGWGVWGGTSVASPIVAAEFALSGGAQAVAYPAATLYTHLGDPSALYDVISGSNGTCSGASSCQAIAGYDGPTGVGSPLGLSAFSTAGTPANSTPPTISGLAEQGQTLSLTQGAWSNSPTSIGHQWADCNSSGSSCSPIAGATGPTYTLTTADVDSTIRVQESAANASGSGPPTVSAQSAVVVSNVPALSGFTPPAGITGSSVTINGSALGGVNSVLFGKLAASFTVLSNTQIEAIVPDGAKAGKIAISAPGGAATSQAKFTPTLSITAFSPKHGVPGKLVTIKGVGFTNSSSVAFNGVPATSVSFISQSKLKAAVPAGAGTGAITVTNTTAPTGTVSSAVGFVVG